MIFVVHAHHRPGSPEPSAQTIVQHLQFVARHARAFRFDGPLLGEGDAPCGSLMILELPDRAALEAHLAADPLFFGAAAFGRVQVWQSTEPLPTPGVLQAAIDRLPGRLPAERLACPA